MGTTSQRSQSCPVLLRVLECSTLSILSRRLFLCLLADFQILVLEKGEHSSYIDQRIVTILNVLSHYTFIHGHVQTYLHSLRVSYPYSLIGVSVAAAFRHAFALNADSLFVFTQTTSQGSCIFNLATLAHRDRIKGNLLGSGFWTLNNMVSIYIYKLETDKPFI